MRTPTIEQTILDKLSQLPCNPATREDLFAAARLCGVIPPEDSADHENIRRLCREIPTEQTASQKGLARFWTTLKNLRTSLSEKSLDVAKKADEVATDYGLPLIVGATSVVPTTQILHYVVETSGQIPTLQTTLYPAAALATLTAGLLAIPWKKTQKELHTKTNPAQNSPEI